MSDIIGLEPEKVNVIDASNVILEIAEKTLLICFNDLHKISGTLPTNLLNSRLIDENGIVVSSNETENNLENEYDDIPDLIDDNDDDDDMPDLIDYYGNIYSSQRENNN